MSLARYRAKRDFSRTREPKGAKEKRSERETKIIFVVQKHAARRMHYDFRLEIDGVLKSWAVPKNVPTIHGEKRLAVQVEDHPSEYGNFEGIIPAGNYGAGTVMLWDAGICEILQDTPRKALRNGKLEMNLAGRKFRGEWTLVRMKPREDSDDNAWLFIRTGEDMRKISAREDDRSIVSGRTMKQITTSADATWQSRKNAHPRRAKPRRNAARLSRQGR